jgi:hypothetical protein
MAPQPAIELLERQAGIGKTYLEEAEFPYLSYDSWQETTREILCRAFGSQQARQVSVFSTANGPWVISSEEDDEDSPRKTAHYRERVEMQLAHLKGFVDQLRMLPSRGEPVSITPGTYDVAQICRNGHVVTSLLRAAPVHDSPFCRECGAPTIKGCPACAIPIRGHYSSAALMPYQRPGFCHQCGTAYPWTASAIAAAKEWAADLESLSPEDRKAVSEDLPDLIRDTARTPVAASRFKRILAKAGVEGATGLKQILVSVVTEAAKRIVWP